MRVSWLDTTFHITVTNIKSIREKSYVPFLHPYSRETRVETPLISTALVQRVAIQGIDLLIDYSRLFLQLSNNDFPLE